MTRRHACTQLLRLGALTEGEVREITRWPRNTCKNVLRHLEEMGSVRRIGSGRGMRWEAA